jgi:hypothetical protein
VFAVHSGPAAAIVAGSVIYLRRHRRTRRAGAGSHRWERPSSNAGAPGLGNLWLRNLYLIRVDILG